MSTNEEKQLTQSQKVKEEKLSAPATDDPVVPHGEEPLSEFPPQVKKIFESGMVSFSSAGIRPNDPLSQFPEGERLEVLKLTLQHDQDSEKLQHKKEMEVIAANERAELEGRKINSADNKNKYILFFSIFVIVCLFKNGAKDRKDCYKVRNKQENKYYATNSSALSFSLSLQLCYVSG